MDGIKNRSNWSISFYQGSQKTYVTKPPKNIKLHKHFLLLLRVEIEIKRYKYIVQENNILPQIFDQFNLGQFPFLDTQYLYKSLTMTLVLPFCVMLDCFFFTESLNNLSLFLSFSLSLFSPSRSISFFSPLTAYLWTFTSLLRILL